MKRAIIIVIDSLGIGAAEDYAEFNDVATCNTICNVAGINLLKPIQTVSTAKLSMNL